MSDCTHVEERIVDLLEDGLAPPERAAVDAHLAGCARCRETVRSYEAIRAAYREVPEADVSLAVAGRILAAARAPARARRRRSLVLLAAAALLAVLVPVAVQLLGPGEDPVPRLVREGDAQRDAGRLVEAHASYEHALALSGDDARAAEILQLLAVIEAERGEPVRALQYLSLLLAEHADSPLREPALLLRAEILERLGQYEEAGKTVERIALDYPEAFREIPEHLKKLIAAEPEAMDTLKGLGYVGGDFDQ